MKNRKLKTVRRATSTMAVIAIPTVLVLLGAGCCRPASKSAPENAAGLPTKSEWTLEKVSASVESINAKTREVTLKGPNGYLRTAKVSDEVERLDEIKAGDLIEVEYWTMLRAEFRAPTAEEKEKPLEVVAESGRAPKDVAPAAAAGAVIRAVVKVIGVDQQRSEAAIKGPQGTYLVVPILDPKVLAKLKEGDTVIMTYAEAVIVSLNQKPTERNAAK